MPIKRIRIEIDDTEDDSSPTAMPFSLTPAKQSKNKENTTEDIPKYDDEETVLAQKSFGKTTNTGRTYPDLISEFIHNPRAIATILIFVPFPFFVKEIKDIDSLKYPTIIGFLLNLVYFTVPLLIKLFGRKSNEK